MRPRGGRQRRCAFGWAAGILAALGAAPALPAASGDAPVRLDTLLVTGSRIPRAEWENAEPVVVLPRSVLESSGLVTVGQLLERLPQVTGDALTPQVNNGGNGNGASTISLRGLGAARTLILLDGRRIVSNDVNLLPLNLIERVEVLTEGAGTVYGSDAIGGVVNFITRQGFSGTEVVASGGVAPEHGDADRLAVSLTTGAGNERSHWVAGLGYDRSDAIRAPDRAVGVAPYLVVFGEVVPGGSSRIPTGAFSIDPERLDPATGEPWGCSTLTRVAGSDGRSAADFRCKDPDERYNYQREAVLYTPGDHVQLFALGSNRFDAGLRGYGLLLLEHTGGHNQLAPEAFDSGVLSDPAGNPLHPVISQYSQYNPLGQDVAPFSLRALETGDRTTHASEDLLQGTLGFTTRLADRFDWDSAIGYGRQRGTYTSHGYLDVAHLKAQVGPSKDGVCYEHAVTNEDGSVSYRDPIAGCAPINLLGTYGTTYSALLYPAQRDRTLTQLSTFDSRLSGDLFALPYLQVPPISAALGFEYRRQTLDGHPDPAARAFQLSTYSSPAIDGAYDVKELYGEFLVPIARDRPLVRSLDLSLGVRWSDFSSFGRTTNGLLAIEYRPERNLLLRATYADLFRSPTASDLSSTRFGAPTPYYDVCNGYGGTATRLFPHLPDACRNVPVGFQQHDDQTRTTTGGNPDLEPETGHSTDFGVVYSPAWFRPLSVSVDAWAYRIHDAIAPLDLFSAMTGCAVSGDPLFCGDGQAGSPYVRDASGAVVDGLVVPRNLGTLSTDGVDFSAQLDFPHTPYGSFRFDLGGSYLDTYRQAVNGSAGGDVLHYALAGQTSASFTGGGFPRLKLNASLDWRYLDWRLVLRNRFVASESDNGGQDGLGNVFGLDSSGAGYRGFVEGFESFGAFGTGRCNEGGHRYTAVDSDGNALFDYVCRRDGEFVDYQDVELTYGARPLRTDFSLGVTNLFDKQVPIAYTNGVNGFAFNYDASNYEVTGRFVYARVRVKFDVP